MSHRDIRLLRSRIAAKNNFFETTQPLKLLGSRDVSTIFHVFEVTVKVQIVPHGPSVVDMAMRHRSWPRQRQMRELTRNDLQV
jgi:hypothetical protein